MAQKDINLTHKSFELERDKEKEKSKSIKCLIDYPLQVEAREYDYNTIEIDPSKSY